MRGLVDSLVSYIQQEDSGDDKVKAAFVHLSEVLHKLKCPGSTF